MKSLAPACLALALLLPSPAAPQSQEYWPEYAAVFRDTCGERETAAVCQCTLDRVASHVGYEALAKEIKRHETRFFLQSKLREPALSAMQYCRALYAEKTPGYTD